MSPGKANKRIVTDRLALIDEAVEDIQKLPLEEYDTFVSDKRNILSAESCLRRSLEGLLDIGRHILAKGYAVGVTEYKEIAKKLNEHSLLSSEEADLLRTMAGYRNRMVQRIDSVFPYEGVAE